MSVVDRILGRPQNLSLEDRTYPLTSGALLDALHIPFGTASSVAVNERKALAMPAVWRAVNLIASTGASLPLHPFKQDEEGSPRRVTSGQASDLLSRPHPDLTPFELWEIEYGHVALWGNGYLRKLRDQSNVIRELWPIHPSMVTPGRASDMSKVYRIQSPDGGEVVLTDREILHIPGFGYDGVCGLSPIRAAARQGVGLALAAEEYGAKLFGSGSLAGGILTTEQRLNQTQADALKDRWKAKIGGLQNAHEIAVLDAGAKFQPLSIPPDDAQFIQSRGFQVEEIARIYGIPPHLLMATEKATSWGTGIEQMTLGWIKFGLRGTWLTRFEQRISGILTPNGVYAKYSLEGLLRGDSAQRAAFYKTMREIGAFNADEIRALEELPPRPGGSDYWEPQSNFGTGDMTTEAADA